MATRSCPACAETIQATAVICRFCKTNLQRAPRRPMRPPVKTGLPTWGIVLVVLLVVVVVGGIAGAILLPVLVGGQCKAREGSAQAVLNQLSQASEMYYADYGVYPPGGGEGTARLVTKLKTPNRRKMPYMEFPPDMLTGAGDVINPVSPESEVIYYKNNSVNFPGNQGDPGAHNKQKFDLWCRDCNGIENGVNNWGG